MEGLLNEYGIAAWWPVLVLVALPLVTFGIALRRSARRRADGVAIHRAARRKISDVTAGQVTVVGRWTPLAGGRGVVEEGEHRVVVDAGAGPALTEGAEVLVVGVATHEEHDPRPSGYREGAKVWVVDARGDGHFVSPGVDALERAQLKARARGSLGAALFAVGLMVAVASGVIAWRAAHEAPTYEDVSN